MVILTYCMAVPVPQLPVFPDSHKNLVKVSWLVRLYVMVLDRVYWQPDWETSEWMGVWGNFVKLISLAFWAHHPIVWNHSMKCFQSAWKKNKEIQFIFFYCLFVIVLIHTWLGSLPICPSQVNCIKVPLENCLLGVS